MTYSRRIVVTGASGGIGRAIAQRFTRDGALVANLDLQPGAEAEALCGPNLRTIAVDLADADSITAAFAAVDALFGQPPDGLVCCAAISAARPVPRRADGRARPAARGQRARHLPRLPGRGAADAQPSAAAISS